MIGPDVPAPDGVGLHWLDFAAVLGAGRRLAVRSSGAISAGRPLAAGARSVLQGGAGASWRTLITAHATRARVTRGRRHQLSRRSIWFVVDPRSARSIVCQCPDVRSCSRWSTQAHADADAAGRGARSTATAASARRRPPPNLLTDEPRQPARRSATQRRRGCSTTYGWVDKNAGVVRMPIDRAKRLLLERGLPGAAGR